MAEAKELPPLPPLRCAGIGLRGSGYPNAINTLRRLQAAGARIDDCVDWLPEGFHLWKASRGPLPTKLALYARLLFGNARAAWRLCRLSRKDRRITYIPYPAIFLLWWLSWVPRRWCPPLVADAYISVWDSTVRDRGLLGSGGMLGRLLQAFEARALRTADVVLVDTAANRRWMIDTFRLEPGSVFAVPLAIDDAALLEVPPRTPEKPLQVLFVGTFVPLHGIDVLVEAVRRAQAHDNIQFHLVGDGQDAGKVEALLSEGLTNFTWERGWISHGQIADRLAQCDVCLGVFGGSAKAARVLPFKLYLALAAGRAVITQEKLSLPEGVALPPLTIVESNPGQVVEHLLVLANDPDRVTNSGREGRSFYQAWLGSEASLRTWRDVLARVSTKPN